MTEVMSKFLAMGVPLEDIIRRSTVNPAKEIRRRNWGHCPWDAKLMSRCWKCSTATLVTSMTDGPGWMEP